MEFNKIVRLKDIAEVEMGQSPKSEFYNEQEGTPFLQGTRTFGLLYPIIDTYTTKVTKWAIEGDILFSVRAPVGDINIATIPLCIGRGLAAIRSKTNNQKFLFYLLKAFNNYEGHSTGTIFSSINKSTLENLEFVIPEENIQSSIGDFLWSIDEKIELNNNIISNLEQLSQTLFKHWFIDFEFPNEEEKPYKSSGGEMVESELGEIPKGWCVSEIDNLGTIIGGGTPSKKYDEYYTNNGISWITPKDLSNNKNTFIYKGAVDITELGLKKSSARILQKDTVLFSSRAPIGYITIAGKEVTTNQGFKSIVPDKGYSSYFIYHLLKFKLPMIEAAAGGSTFKEISGKGLKEIPVTLPSVELVNRYKEIVEPLFLQIQMLEKENQNLQQLRDTLLPKLLSGEIEIPDELKV